MRVWPVLWEKRSEIASFAILISIGIFLLQYFTPSVMLKNTMAAGADLQSHYYPAFYLKTYLLPRFKIYGWCPGQYCGFPMFLLYFPLPFLAMSLLSILLPLAVAFKLVVASGSFLIPLGAFLCLRQMQYPLPVSAVGAAFMLPFILNEGNSVWGGNINSTLAGEFCYQIGLAFLIYFMGSLYRGVKENRFMARNAVLLALIGLTHGYSLVFSLGLLPYFLFAASDRTWQKRMLYLAGTYGLGFSLMSFWFLPVLGSQPWTISYRLIGEFQPGEAMFPFNMSIFLVFLIMALVLRSIRFMGAQYCAVTPNIKWRTARGMKWIFRMIPARFQRVNFLSKALCLADGRMAYLLFHALITAPLLFLYAFKTGVVDFRYLPFIQVLLLLASSIGFWTLAQGFKNKAAVALLVVACVILWSGSRESFGAEWIRGSFQGVDKAKEWPLFLEICRYLKGSLGDPRVAIEPSDAYESFGTPRAFESLPLFAGRQTLEGLYLQSSANAPCIFYNQAEMSGLPPCPFRDYHYPRFDLDRAVVHFKLFNVRDVVVTSDQAKEAFRSHSEFRRKKTFGDIEIFELLTNENRYVTPVRFRPVVIPTRHWKSVFYDWFRKTELNAVPLIYNAEEKDPKDGLRDFLSASDLSEVRAIPLDPSVEILEESVEEEKIEFMVSRTGVPVLIKVTYHPNWRVRGADKIYHVSPSYMLVYPREKKVRMWFARSWIDHAGLVISLTALAGILLSKAGIFRPQFFRLQEGAFLEKFHKPVMYVSMATYSCLLVFGIFQYRSSYQFVYNRAMNAYDSKDYDTARLMFEDFLSRYGNYSLGDEAHFYYAMSAYRRDDYSQAVEDFSAFLRLYPDSFLLPDALYHLGLALNQTGRTARAEKSFRRLIREFPGTDWAAYARDLVPGEKQGPQP